MEPLQCLATSNTMRAVVAGCGLYLMLGRLPGITIQDGLDLDILGLVVPYYDPRGDRMDDHFLITTIILRFYTHVTTQNMLFRFTSDGGQMLTREYPPNCQDFQMFCFPHVCIFVYTELARIFPCSAQCFCYLYSF